MWFERCPVCGGELEQFRSKLLCRRCGPISSCCDGAEVDFNPASQSNACVQKDQPSKNEVEEEENSHAP